ncbi:hypothetical protein CPB83DRAFT_776047 [Crepidotus variabilis]|uniref:Uncharacterized protein n=1 Tax=Crepidotus variabilis TaxID=179855 RepID=A0A9P6JJR7_9AGAR|nr:hypothetical protein CPB83DRAFT_776047 [Crepidotus variabilis]
MSLTSNGPEAQDALLNTGKSLTQDVPPQLARATMRLEFSPSYVLVGVYRLFTDKLLYIPAWDKCKHAAQRGAVVGAAWAFFTFSIQKRFIEMFLSNSPRITGLSSDTMFGYPLPFSIHTYATIMIIGSQVTRIMQFFLRKNLRIARDRAWDQTVKSRGKGPEFWQPYVEEWARPPRVASDTKQQKFVKKYLGGWFGLFVIKRVLLSPFQIYPFVGMAVTSWFRALGTAHILHRRYFESKRMSESQVQIFMEERKWDYRAFGFTAAFLESLPIIGLVFTVSNRVGAAMWAHDLEKRQHYFAEERRAGRLESLKKS